MTTPPKAKQRYVITLASERHLEQIHELERRIFDRADPFTRRRLRYLLRSPNATYFLCSNRHTPIGYGIALKQKLRNGKTKGRIYSLGIVSAWQGRGAGTLLLKHLEDWLTDLGVAFITLETRKKRGAKGFFEKFGYRVSEDLPDYYGSEDGLRMKKLVLNRHRSKETKFSARHDI